jgi:hypothetical protein
MVVVFARDAPRDLDSSVRKNLRAWACGLAIAAVSMSIEGAADADEPSFGPDDVATAFFISKSDDRNRVDYGMRLNSQCAPRQKDAIFPYWREFENSPPVRTHSLGMWEWIAYGLSEQRLYRTTPTGSIVLVRLKQVGRAIWIFTKGAPDGGCTATARSTIAGVEGAQLLSIYVKLKGPLSVDYIDIKGKVMNTGQLIEERVTE